MIAKAQPFPNLFLSRPDGTSMELVDLRKRQHALILFIRDLEPGAAAFVGLFQGREKLFQWLEARLIPVFPDAKSVFSPWPAPGYPACLPSNPLPEGLEWGSAYVVSKNGTLMEIYPNLAELSVEKVESDFLYWEAGHCLPS